MSIEQLNPLSSDDARKLLEDRVQFKLYAAKQHLKNLQNFLDRNGIYMNSSFQSRVYSEILIEDLLFQLVGSVDAFLIRINDKLGLGLKEESIYSNSQTVMKVSNKLETQGKSELLTELQNALKSEKRLNGPEEGDRLWNLRELRNRGAHRQLINIAVTPGEIRIIQLRTI
jgi:hypothetical protein